MTSSDKQSNSIPRVKRGFLDLPYELRLPIYEHSLVSKTPIAVTDDGAHPSQHQKRNHLQPQLLQVCAQLYNEGVEILYGSNTFEACFVNEYLGRQFWKWLQQIGPANVARLNRFKFSLRYPPLSEHMNFGLFCVETTVILNEPHNYKYTATYQEDTNKPWSGDLEPDPLVEEELESLFRVRRAIGEQWQTHYVMSIYVAAMKVRPELRPGTDLETVPSRAWHFFEQARGIHDFM